MAGNLPTIVDDDGSGTTGTVLNKAIWDQVFVPWTDIAFNAANFTGSSSMTWTVGSLDQITLAYTLAGDIVTVTFVLTATTVGGTPSTMLQITLPFSASNHQFCNTYVYQDNGGSATAGLAQIVSGDNTIRLYTAGFASWTAATNNTSVYGQISYQKA